MTETKLIDGCLPCLASENCVCKKLCGGAFDYKMPNTKKLMCLINHIDELAKQLYERDGLRPVNTIADYAFQMAWIMHNELADTISLLQKWNEPVADFSVFLECYENFKRFYERNDVTFLSEQYQQLRQIANAHSTVLIQ